MDNWLEELTDTMHDVGYKKGYQKGYADAIDDVVRMAEEMNITYPHANIADDEKEELAEYMHTSIVKSVKWIAEKLKEQKNDSQSKR